MEPRDRVAGSAHCPRDGPDRDRSPLRAASTERVSGAAGQVPAELRAPDRRPRPQLPTCSGRAGTDVINPSQRV